MGAWSGAYACDPMIRIEGRLVAAKVLSASFHRLCWYAQQTLHDIGNSKALDYKLHSYNYLLTYIKSTFVSGKN